MAKLLILESKHKAETVGRFIGKGYKVIASDGHIIDLPKSRLGIDVENGFKPKYIKMRDKGAVAKELQAEAKKADEILLASDPDREGEAIAWHLANFLGIPTDKCCRVTFNEITKKCIEASLKEPRSINIDLVNAQQARRILDRLVGYEISPILWHKVKSGLSAGRVQSAVLKMIVDREREIEGFKPEEYWELDVNLATIKPKKKFTAHFYGDKNGRITFNSEAQIKAVEAILPTAEYKVTEYKEGTKSQNPQAPFTTSTLQQDASHKINFASKKTMQIAQQLYEGVNVAGYGAIGLVTYIRTDSVRVSDEAVEAVRAYISSEYGSKYVPSKPIVHKSKKKIQDAHEAIRPTNIELQPDKIKASLTNDQYKLYKLIYNRFVSSQMSPAKYATVNATISANDNYLFKASSSKRTFDGYLAVYSDREDKEKQNAVPELNAGDSLNFVDSASVQHFTQPPARYNNASIIKEMEENGIGRPSTYAATMETLFTRYYIEKLRTGNAIAPTPLGICVSDIVSENFTEITDVKFTASMEEKLDDVADGTKDWVKVLSEFYSPFKKALDKAGDIAKVEVPLVVSDIPCPNCGAMLVERVGRFGKFLACPNYPECKTTQPLPENEVKEPCPVCGGKLVQRISKKGKRFYGCSNYPDCHFAASGIPTGEKCPKCGEGYLIHGYNNRIICNRFNCKYEKKNDNKESE